MSHSESTARSNHASAVEGLKCADLVDAMGRLHRHRCHILDLVSPTPGRVLFGPAVTISYFPSCSAALDPERYNLANLFHEAVGDDPAGQGPGAGLERLHRRLDGRGNQAHARFSTMVWRACSPTGACATSTSSRGYDFAAYCAGEATRWGGGEVTPFQANVPVVLRGVGVIPGTYVFADSSGAVVIPPDDLEQVLAEARSIEADDARYREEIAREGRPK